MNYVVSNIHGNYEKFKALLSEIRFKDSDVMYILGDIVDYGDDPIGLICDISMRYNVLPILGDCDYNALKHLTELDKMLAGESPSPEELSDMAQWMANGGKRLSFGYGSLRGSQREWQELSARTRGNCGFRPHRLSRRIYARGFYIRGA